MQEKIDNLKKLSNCIRFLGIDAIEKAKSGHPGIVMGMADVACILFKNHLRFCANYPKWPNRDRFILSAGHGSMLLYSLLYLTNYKDINLDDIKDFRQLHSKTAGHPEFGYLEGIETTTGPLGQGFANAIGIALNQNILNAKFGNTINYYTYVIASDGDLMEGISHEAASLAGHLQLSKLIVLYDSNNISIDGKLDLSCSDNVKKRFESYNWQVLETDAHDFLQIDEVINKAKTYNRPVIIICNSIIGFGSVNKANSEKVHGSCLGAQEIVLTRENLNWPYKEFEIPIDLKNQWEAMGNKYNDEVLSWQKNTSTEIQNFINAPNVSTINAITQELKNNFISSKPNVASRVSLQMCLEEINKKLPLIGGSADLSPSNNTKTSLQKVISKSDYDGNYIHYGIREHAMAGIMNGISLCNTFIPYGGTFLCFLDYLKPSLRLSSIMQQGVIYIFTHDSIFLGEDGSTHQPIEHLTHLRSIPNLLTLRPMDAIEVAECLEIAIKNRAAPSALILSRQDLAFIERDNFDVKINYSSFGAYIVKESHKNNIDNSDDYIIIATGSEVALAVELCNSLLIKNIKSRVVSVPCLSLFNKQSSAYQNTILASSSKAKRIIIEAASINSWTKILRENDIFIGMDDFGLSAPIGELKKHFGFNVDTIIDRIFKK